MAHAAQLKDEEDDDPTHRLHDIETEEVSVVDRAANKRRFLLVKRSEDMSASSTELTSDGKGGFEDPKKVSKGDDEEAKKAAEAEAKAKAKKEADDKAAAEKAKGDADKSKGKDKTKQDEDEDKKPPFLKGAATTVHESAAKLVGCAKALHALVEKGESGEELPDDVKKNLEAVVESVGTVLKPSVEKAGRRMSKERFERFKSALTLLGKLLDELSGEIKPSVGKSEGASPTEVRLLKAVGELTSLVKARDEKIAQLESGVIDSNRIPVEDDSRTKTEKVEKVSWPMDMNNPVQPWTD